MLSLAGEQRWRPGAGRSVARRRRALRSTFVSLGVTAALLATACVQEIPSDPVPTTAAPTTAAPTTSEVPATTTTTVPDDPTEPDEPEFGFEQPATLMTEPGESIVVKLAGYEPDGEPNGQQPPEGVAYDVLGDTDAFTIDDLGAGSMRVTGTGAVGGIVIAAKIPGQPLAATTEIFTVELADGVVVPAPDVVVFPSLAGDRRAELSTTYNDVVDADGVGPFSWAEVTARYRAPVSTGTPDALTGSVDGVVPAVVRGAAFAVGTVIADAPSGVYGVVVEPAEHPTIERDGFSLVSVRDATILELYRRAKWTIDTDELAAASIVPERFTYDYQCADDVEADDCESLEETDALAYVNGTSYAASEVVGSSASGGAAPRKFVGEPRFARSPARAAAASSDGIGTPIGDGGACKAGIGTAIGEFKVAEGSVDLRPKFDLDYNIDRDNPSAEFMKFAVGYTSSVSVKMTGKLQPATSVEVDCELKDLGDLHVPIPAGPFSAAASLRLQGAIVAEFEVKVEAGPSVEFELACGATEAVIRGRHFTSSATGFLDHATPITEDSVSHSCPGPTTKGGFGANAAGVEAKAELTAFAGLAVTVGIQAGGRVGARLAKWFGDGDEGFLELVEFKMGVRAKAVFESIGRVLRRGDAETAVLVEDYYLGELELPWISALGRAVGKDASWIEQNFSLVLFEGTRTSNPIFDPPKASEGRPTIKVNGDRVDGDVRVEVDDVVHISAEFPDNARISPELEAAWVYLDTGGVSQFTKIEQKVSAFGTAIDGSFTINEALCDTIGDQGAIGARVVADVVLFDFLGAKELAPGWGGEFRIECIEPALKFGRESIDFGRDETAFPATATLQQTLLGGADWELDTHPSWLEVSPSEGVWSNEKEGERTLVVRAVCANVEPKAKVSTTLTARSDIPDEDEQVTATMTVSADCRDTYLDANPKSAHVGWNGGTVNVTIDSYGPHPVVVRGPGSITKSGLLLTGRDSVNVTLSIPGATRKCVAQPSRKFTYNYSSDAADPSHGSGRGSFTLTVTRGAVPAKTGGECKKWARVYGDPHLATFDGASFGAQTVGEYWYARPEGVQPNTDLEIQARHEATRSGAAYATVATALDVSVAGHDVEWYVGTIDNPRTRVKVDGAVTPMTEGMVIDIGDGVSLTASANGSYLLEIPEGMVSVGTRGGILDLGFLVEDNTDVRGLLGNPDDDRLNDLMTSDGTIYTEQTLRLHGLELLDLAGSWRVGERTESNFSETYAGFHDTLSEYDPVAIAAKRAEAAGYVAGLSTICSTPTGDDLDYYISMLATELAAGTIETTFSQLTCGYRVSGQMTTDLPDGSTLGVPGMAVRVSEGARLGDCETVTSSNGSYSCILTPRSADVLPPNGSAPVNFTITGSWGDGVPRVSMTATTAELAGLGEAHVALEANGDVDIADLATVNLTGQLRMNLDGIGLAPVRQPVGAEVRALDDDGEVLYVINTVLTPDASGVIAQDFYLPGHSTDVEVVFVLGRIPEDYPTLRTAVSTGSNTLDAIIDFAPKLTDVSGTLVDWTGAPLPSPTIRVTPILDGAPIAGGMSTPVAVDGSGSYRLLVQLPGRANGYRVEAQIGVLSADYPNALREGLTAGLNPLELSTVYDPPRLALTGELTDAVGGCRDGIWVNIDSYTGPGGTGTNTHRTTLTLPCNEDGGYHVETPLPLGTTSALATFGVGPFSVDREHLTIDDLAPGLTTTAFSYRYDPPLLDLSGTLFNGDAPFETTDIIMRAFDADDVMLDSVRSTVEPDPSTGAYHTGPVTLPLRTVRVEATYRLGDNSANWVAQEFDGLTAGTNAVVHNIDLRIKQLVVGGTAHRADLPMATVAFDVTLRDGDGETVSNIVRTAVPDPVTGQYLFAIDLAPGIASATVTARVGLIASEWITRDLATTSPGVTSLTMNLSHEPTLVDITGSMRGPRLDTGTYGPLSGTQTVAIVAFDQNDQQIYTRSMPVMLNSIDGTFSGTVEVPAATASVKVTAAIARHSFDNPSVSTGGIVAFGRTPVVLTAVYEPVVILASGQIVIGGTPWHGGATLYVSAESENRTTTWPIPVYTDETGSYTASTLLPLGTTSAEFTLRPNGLYGNGSTVTITPPATGFVPVVASLIGTTTEVGLSGNLEVFDTILDGPVDVKMREFDANGEELGSARIVTLHANGADRGRYTTEIPVGTEVRAVQFELDAAWGEETVVITSERKTLVVGAYNAMGWSTHGSVVDFIGVLTADGVPIDEPVDVVARDIWEEEWRFRDTSYVALPDVDGTVRIRHFVPYPTAGGNYTTDPVKVQFRFSTDTDTMPVIRTVTFAQITEEHTDEWGSEWTTTRILPEYHRLETDVELTSEPLAVNIDIDDDIDTVTLRSYRIDDNAGLIGAALLVDEVEVERDAAGQYSLVGKVAATATHVRIVAGESGLERVVELGARVDGNHAIVDLALAGGPDPIVITGTISVMDHWACGTASNQPIRAMMRITAERPDPANPGETFTETVLQTLVLPESDGTYRVALNTDLDTAEALTASLITPTIGMVSSETASVVDDLTDYQQGTTRVIELNVEASCSIWW